MTEVYLVKHKFKPGTGKKEWLDWSNELKSREQEVLTTLRNEGVRLEACFLSEDEDCVYYFMEVEDLKKAYEVFERSKIPVDREHEKVKLSAFVSEVYLKKLFDFRSK
jgi:L-rhamnose mutarotase